MLAVLVLELIDWFIYLELITICKLVYTGQGQHHSPDLTVAYMLLIILFGRSLNISSVFPSLPSSPTTSNRVSYTEPDLFVIIYRVM
jgi:hypothetical protein